MNNLIKVQVNEKGKPIVSAKDLYLGLGMDKSNWAKWYKKNILKNSFFLEKVYWIGVRTEYEGNETMDFAITLEFAKHIAMMAKTEKSHEYRNYFIECEKQLFSGQTKSSLDLLELQVKALKKVKGEVQEVRNEFEEFKEDLLLMPEELQKVVRKIGTRALGGHGSPAYKNKSLLSKVYKNVWKFLKDQFNVNTYKDIKRKYLDKAKEIAESYEASFYL